MTNDNDLTDDILVAFADKELDAEEMKRLKPIIEANSDALKKVKQYEESAEQLRGYFSVANEVEAPAHIVSKIRAISNNQISLDSSNVVSITSRRFGFANMLQSVSTSYGFQKIAASLIVGVFIGVGGYSQIDKLSDQPNNERLTSPLKETIGVNNQKYQRLLSNNVGSREAFNSAWTSDSRINLTLIRAGDKILPGSTISKKHEYQLSVELSTAGFLSITYYSGKEASKVLINKKQVQVGEIINFPGDEYSGIKITTKENLINFHVNIETQNQSYDRYYVFGVTD